MKKILFSTAVAALLMTSCADNELLDGGVATPNDGKIYFSATSGVPTNTKALPVNSTGDLQKIGTFYVAGYHNGVSQIVGTGNSGQAVTWEGLSWEYKNEPYWPASGTMNFLAYANWGAAPTISATGITSNVTIAEDGTAGNVQKDLLVAATYDAQKETRTLLTFKHALTQIVFKAGNWSEAGKADALDVIIGGIKLVNVSEKGTMTVSKATDGKAQIVWNGTDPQTARREDYAVSHIGPTATPNPSNGYTVERITNANKTTYSKYPRVQSAAEPANNALMLVPQDFTAWNPLGSDDVEVSTQHGAYIEIDAIIRKENAASQAEWYCGTYNATLANAAYGKIYIPVSSLPAELGRWEAGKRINYIITFGDKNSGTGGGGYDKEGNPILVPIRFRAVVEDWVDTNVPLLTAQFEATSSAITNRFITGYVNQLLTDVKSAPAPKTYDSNVRINGTVSANVNNVTYDDASLSEVTAGGAASNQFLATLHTNEPLSSKFLPGSTVTYDLTKVTVADFASQTLTLKVPAGWEARTYLDAASVDPNPSTATAIGAGNNVTMSATANKIVLKKIPTSGYDYYPHLAYIEDNIAAIELNENYCTPSVYNFARKVVANDIIPVPAGTTGDYYYNFSCDMLSKFSNAFVGASVVLDLTNVTGFSATAGSERGVRTWVPLGWKAVVNGNTYYGGDVITLTDATNATITLTRIAGGSDHTYHSIGLLTDWLTSSNVKTSGEIFYYNNVDFDVQIDVTQAPWTSIAAASVTGTAVVQLKYPLSDAKLVGDVVLGTSGKWSYDATTGKLTYTK